MSEAIGVGLIHLRINSGIGVAIIVVIIALIAIYVQEAIIFAASGVGIDVCIIYVGRSSGCHISMFSVIITQKRVSFVWVVFSSVSEEGELFRYSSLSIFELFLCSGSLL